MLPLCDLYFSAACTVVKGDPQSCSEVASAPVLQTRGSGCSSWCCRRSVPPEWPMPSDNLGNGAAKYTILHLAQCLLAFLECFRCGRGRGCGSVYVARRIPSCPLPVCFTRWVWRVVFAWLKMQACGWEAVVWAERVRPHVWGGCAQHCSRGGRVLSLGWVQRTQEGCGMRSRSAAERVTESQNVWGWKGPLWVI